MNLSSVFTEVAHKVLVAVDLPNLGSNQHELNGVGALRGFFGTSEPSRGILSWHYFADDQEPVQSTGEFTFYDARAKSATRTGRSEWRFYYEGSFLAIADVGDRFFLARSRSGQLFALVFQGGSAWLRAAHELFGVRISTALFDSVPRKTLDQQELELLRRQIIEELNLDLAVPVQPSD